MTPQQDFYHIGVDVSKLKLDIYILQTEEHFICENNPKGINSLISRLPRNSVIVMESTGGYERACARALDQNEFKVAIVNPKPVYHFRQSFGSSAKTDKIDARVLAEFAKYRRNIHYGLKTSAQQERADLCRYREQLRNEKAKMKTRRTMATLAYIKKSMSQLIQKQEKEIEKIEKKIKLLLQKSEEDQALFELVKTVPCIGDKIALTLINLLPEIGKLSHKQLASLVGVAPIASDSGQFRGKRFIQGGRISVRNALYMGALTGLKWNPLIQECYDRHVSRGKPKKQALVASMHKLLRIINSIAKHQTPFKLPS